MVGIKFRKSIDNIFGFSSVASNCEPTPESNFASVIIQDDSTTSKPTRPQTLPLKNPIVVLQRCDPIIIQNKTSCLDNPEEKV